MSTGVVAITSDLVRKKWMREGLLQAASKSFWSPYTGTSKDNIVFQKNDASASEGHTVVFDFDGNLSQRAIKGKDTAFGKGEQKKKFSDKITVSRYRLVVDNGDKFDAVNIGDLSISEHGDSRAKLGDLFIRFKDQALFDTAQGVKGNVQPTHKINIDASSTALSYQDLATIEMKLRTGTGFVSGLPDGTTTAASRAPLAPYRLADGRSIWLMVIDPYTAANFKSNTTANSGIMAMAQSADLRGNDNRVFKGIIGQIGQLVLVEAEAFFGVSDGTDATALGLNQTDIEIAGMRQYDATNSAWSGQAAFASAEYSRNLILGAGALQIAFGKQPDYKFKTSQDFDIKSESAVEFWMEAQKTNLTAENADYTKAKRASLDHGVIAFDVKL
jgi:hypothetical protein